MIGEDGRGRELPGWMLRNVLRSLDADACDQAEFTCSGAFRSLATAAAREKCRDVVVDGWRHRIWGFRDEIIMASRRVSTKGRLGRTEQWSRFIRRELRTRRRTRGSRNGESRCAWREGAWHVGAMDVGSFLAIVERSPELWDVFVNRD